MSFLTGITPSWSRPPSSGAYSAVAVNFDGTNDYLTHSGGLTGAADSKLMTLCYWIRSQADNTFGGVLAGHFSTGGVGNARLRIYHGASNRENFAVNVQDGGGSWALQMEGALSTTEVADGWRCKMFSVDMADTGKRWNYDGDTTDYTTSTTYVNAALDFTLANWAIGGFQDGTDKLNADLCNFMLWTGSYIDFSVEANRRMFFSATGKPVDPDASGGAVATLGTPIIRLTNPLSTWHQNAGSGGDFTVNGALSSASSSPSD